MCGLVPSCLLEEHHPGLCITAQPSSRKRSSHFRDRVPAERAREGRGGDGRARANAAPPVARGSTGPPGPPLGPPASELDAPPEHLPAEPEARFFTGSSETEAKEEGRGSRVGTRKAARTRANGATPRLPALEVSDEVPLGEPPPIRTIEIEAESLSLSGLLDYGEQRRALGGAPDAEAPPRVRRCLSGGLVRRMARSGLVRFEMTPHAAESSSESSASQS